MMVLKYHVQKLMHVAIDSGKTSLNACKNILVVNPVIDQPLTITVLRALYLEWGNPRCCVLVLRARIGDCIFRSIKNNPQGGVEKDERY